MRAILLAAGEGSRLRPFTVDKPKPMIRAGNRPIAQLAVEALVANGVKDITFVVGYHREKVQSYFGVGRKFGANISYAFQEVLSGTASALATAPAPTGPFLVLGGDNVVEPSLIKSALSSGDGPAVVVHRSSNPSRYGVVTLDGSRVARIEEKPREPRSDWVNTGVYRLPASFHELTRKAIAQGAVGIPDVLQLAISKGTPIEAVKSTDLWADAVYPWDLLRMHADLVRGAQPKPITNVAIESGVLLGQDSAIGPWTLLGAGTCVGGNVEIGANSVIENCVIYDDVQIGPGAILRNTIIGEGSRIGPRFTALSGACDIQTADGWHHLDDFGSVIGVDAAIGGRVTLEPGTILGNRTRVGHDRTIRGRMQDGSIAY